MLKLKAEIAKNFVECYAERNLHVSHGPTFPKLKESGPTINVPVIEEDSNSFHNLYHLYKDFFDNAPDEELFVQTGSSIQFHPITIEDFEQ